MLESQHLTNYFDCAAINVLNDLLLINVRCVGTTYPSIFLTLTCNIGISTEEHKNVKLYWICSLMDS